MASPPESPPDGQGSPPTGRQSRAPAPSPRQLARFDVMLILGLILFCLAAGLIRERRTKPEPPVRAALVRAVRPIPAFARITTEDVRVVLDSLPIPAGAARLPSEVIDRVASQPVDSGAVLLTRRLVELPGEWMVVRVPADTGLAGRLGDTMLVVSAMQADSPRKAVTDTAVSLGLWGGKTNLAVRPPSLLRFAAYYLKDARFLPVRRIPPAPGDTIRPPAPAAPVDSPATRPRRRR
ncbi:MAG TPA: SAF domain-containing protein [Longimicrobiaceae bacterium]|nr:SAF domain-containing protein [Longimicrobiaceae bacterium]